MARFYKSRNNVSSLPQGFGQLFEETVLAGVYKNENNFFEKTKNPVKDRHYLPQNSKSKHVQQSTGPKNQGQSSSGTNYQYWRNGNEFVGNGKNLGWWRPQKNSLIFKFFDSSSMHGLKFIAQPQRHLSERIFWAVSFLSAMIAAGFLINSVWTTYYSTPVIVTFDSTEMDINSIPFPAVTVCNMNKIPNNVLNDLYKRYNEAINEASQEEIWKEFQYVKVLCDNQWTFAKRLQFADKRGHVALPYDSNISLFSNGPQNSTLNLKEVLDDSSEILAFFLRVTPPCDEMILKCLWGGEVVDCRQLFKATLTEYGKCCSFNRLPGPLLDTNKVISKSPRTRASNSNSNPTENQSKSDWTAQELKEWENWDYKKGFVLDGGTKYPFRQARAGATFGLSILLDSNVDRYFCPAQDSMGFRLSVGSPLERAEVENFGVGIGLDQEVSIIVRPELTLADPGIRQFHYEKRQCLFEDDAQLHYFQPYSTKNCILECTAKIVGKNCSCVPFTLPRTPLMQICPTDRSQPKRVCAWQTRRKINKNLRHYCGECRSLCSELSYRYKVSTAKLLDRRKLWSDHKMKNSPEWENHSLSIVHVYFGKEKFVPLMRAEFYGLRDLIANTGNILCLCLGFSVLSAVEIIFFFTIRPCWDYFRNRRNPKNGTGAHVKGKIGGQVRNSHLIGVNKQQNQDPTIDSHQAKITRLTSVTISIVNENENHFSALQSNPNTVIYHTHTMSNKAKQF